MKTLDQKLDDFEFDGEVEKPSMFPSFKFFSDKLKNLSGIGKLIPGKDDILKAGLKKTNEATEYPEDRGDPMKFDDLQGNYYEVTNDFQDSEEAKTLPEEPESHPFD